MKQGHDEKDGGVQSAASQGALKRCEGSVDKLIRWLEMIEPGFASTSRRARKWTAFKSVLGGKHLRQIQERIEKAKATLSLAAQSSTR